MSKKTQNSFSIFFQKKKVTQEKESKNKQNFVRFLKHKKKCKKRKWNKKKNKNEKNKKNQVGNEKEQKSDTPIKGSPRSNETESYLVIVLQKRLLKKQAKYDDLRRQQDATPTLEKYKEMIDTLTKQELERERLLQEHQQSQKMVELTKSALLENFKAEKLRIIHNLEQKIKKHKKKEQFKQYQKLVATFEQNNKKFEIMHKQTCKLQKKLINLRLALGEAQMKTVRILESQTTEQEDYIKGSKNNLIVLQRKIKKTEFDIKILSQVVRGSSRSQDMSLMEINLKRKAQRYENMLLLKQIEALSNLIVPFDRLSYSPHSKISPRSNDNDNDNDNYTDNKNRNKIGKVGNSKSEYFESKLKSIQRLDSKLFHSNSFNISTNTTNTSNNPFNISNDRFSNSNDPFSNSNNPLSNSNNPFSNSKNPFNTKMNYKQLQSNIYLTNYSLNLFTSSILTSDSETFEFQKTNDNTLTRDAKIKRTQNLSKSNYNMMSQPTSPTCLISSHQFNSKIPYTTSSTTAAVTTSVSTTSTTSSKIIRKSKSKKKKFKKMRSNSCVSSKNTLIFQQTRKSSDPLRQSQFFSHDYKNQILDQKEGPIQIPKCKPELVEKTKIIKITTLSQLLSITKGIEYFKEFLFTQYNQENILFFQQVKKFKQECRTEKQIAKEAKKIFLKFIKPESLFEINIVSEMRKKIISQIQLKKFSLQMFNDAQEAVFNHLELNSFKDFLQSDLYEELIQKLKANNQSQDYYFNDQIKKIKLIRLSRQNDILNNNINFINDNDDENDTDNLYFGYKDRNNTRRDNANKINSKINNYNKPNQLIEELLTMVLDLLNIGYSISNKSINLKSVSKMIPFTRFVKKTAKLKYVNLDLMNDKQRLCFFLNCYNVMMLHSFIINGIPKDLESQKKQRKKSKYIIGDHVFSLLDIFNGILRNNKNPKQTNSYFKNNDPRAKYKIKKLDPRIHFAIINHKFENNIKSYTVGNLDQTLHKITSNVFKTILHEKSHLISLPKRFQKYINDFGGTYQLKFWILNSYNLRPSKKKKLDPNNVDDKGFGKYKKISIKYFNENHNKLFININIQRTFLKKFGHNF
ncbi:electron carrier/ protein disulfide oxidoreductase [Anaeramoeba flamelloides]|uniref:Electron carrier/ protein disulfide oxidoreductase n=1 Tax=Anaeramoeba flamelloides TaxID=1746091 RepID=A0ABQ8Z9V7_9EUKA|nr:electron carrier/ protein disulfide oxidoreductase [Anaeramoeba flamelloides]